MSLRLGLLTMMTDKALISNTWARLGRMVIDNWLASLGLVRQQPAKQREPLTGSLRSAHRQYQLADVCSFCRS